MKRIRLWSILLVICCFLVGCSSFSKHTITNVEEIHTEVFLEKPDRLICIKKGTEKQLSSDALETIYTAFMKLMDTLQHTDSLKTPFQLKYVKEWKEKYTCFEFRYVQRHNYTGRLDDEQGLFAWGNLRFDAFLFVSYSGGLIAVPYLADDYVGINDLFLFLTFPEEELNQFIALI